MTDLPVGQLVFACPSDPSCKDRMILGTVSPLPGGRSHLFVDTRRPIPIKCLKGNVVPLGTGNSFGLFQEVISAVCQDSRYALERDGATHHYVLCREKMDGTAEAVRLEDNRLVQLTAAEAELLRQQQTERSA